MMKKLLTVALCLLLAALPLAATAATEYQVTLVPGDAIAAQESAKQMFDMLALRIVGGEKSGLLSVTLGGQEFVGMAARLEKDGLYVQSALLSDDVLYFSKADLEALTAQSMKDKDADAQTANQAQQMIARIFAVTEVTAANPQTATPTLEDALEKCKDDPGMTAFLQNVQKNLKITEGEFTDDEHDAASKKTELTLTSDDFRNILTSKYMEKFMGGNAADVEKLQHSLDTLEMNVPMTVLAADGEKLMAMDIPMTIKGTVEKQKMEDGKSVTETEKVNALVNMSYRRLTKDGVVNHSAEMTMTDDDEDKAAFHFLLTDDTKGLYTLSGALRADDDADEAFQVEGHLDATGENPNGWLGMLGDGTQITLRLLSESTKTGKSKSIAIYTREKATSLIEPAASDRPFITLNVAVNNDADATALAAIDSATPETSLQLLQLPEEERTKALQEISTRLNQTLSMFGAAQ